MYEIRVRGRFSSAHHLDGYDGMCSSVHGHNWEVEVHIRGNKLNRTGILLDFREAKKILAEVLAELDHKELNNLKPFHRKNPTSENIAKYIYEKLSRAIDCRAYRIYCVTVHETPETQASYYGVGKK
jgi:6-pyruvoyltetrahydropterin/6-carboxytetrahydropterin synthase